MNIKSRKVLAILLVLALFLTGCSSSSGTVSKEQTPSSPSAQDSASAPAPKPEKLTVSISAGPSGGNNYLICAGMADIVTKSFPNYIMSTEISTGSQQNVRHMVENVAQMGIAMGDATLYSYKAEREFTDLQPELFRYVIGGYSTMIHIMVPANSSYQSVSDLKGKKIAVSKGITGQYYMPIVLDAYGLTPSDVNITELQLADLTNALADGTVEMIMHITSYPLAALSDLAASKAVRILSFSDEVINAISSKYPYFTHMTIPAGTYTGVSTTTDTIGTMNSLVCRADLNEEFVYNFVKTVIEENADVAAIHPVAADFNINNTKIGAVIPIHPGAERYYKEKGAI
jgi:TRAP transporter TAXI family solute receptor